MSTQYVDSLESFSGSIGELSAEVNGLLNKYGKEAIITFDAGTNEVLVYVETVKSDCGC